MVMILVLDARTIYNNEENLSSIAINDTKILQTNNIFTLSKI